MSKITYTNKVALNVNSSIPETNKITAENMNEIKNAINQSINYNATTEDGTGKIKCTLTGTLASGDIVNISIPTLANTSATMQLSIDGGTTYYYIKQMSDDAVFNDYSNTEISASKCTLYFDGTQFILDKSKFGGKIITNLNTIVRNGGYTAFGTATGVPNTSYSWFIKHENSNAGNASAYQRAVAYSTTLIVYERVKQNSTWGNWVNTTAEATTTTNGLMSSSDKTKLNNLTTYSTVEQKTGEKWIDGKDIYRTVTTGTFANDLNFHAVATKVSTFIDVGGTAQNRPFTYFLTTANNVGTIDIVNVSGTLNFRLRSTDALGNQVFSLILRYTKTS